eukprot:scaffold60138_cov66-Phaeocystis_antarctica.AAC.2
MRCPELDNSLPVQNSNGNDEVQFRPAQHTVYALMRDALHGALKAVRVSHARRSSQHSVAIGLAAPTLLLTRHIPHTRA